MINPRDQSVPLEFAQRLGEHLLRHALGAALEVAIAPGSGPQQRD